MGCYSTAQSPPPDPRFWAKVTKTESCWLWTGYVRNGYGRLTRGGRQYQAHRLTYEAVNGRIPPGQVIDHLCRVTRCVNPDHMEAVTQAVNIDRGGWFVAENARKTRCPEGHPYTDDNLYIIPSTGGRACRTCKALARAGEKARHRQRRALGLGPGKPGRPKRTN